MAELRFTGSGYVGKPDASKKNTWHGGNDASLITGAKLGDVWYTTGAVVTNPGSGGGFAANYNQVGVIGDSLTAMNGNGPNLVINDLVSAGFTKANIHVTGVYGMRICDNSGGSSGNVVSSLPSLAGISATGIGTLEVIRAYRTAGFDPRVWYIALGTNNELAGSGGSATWASQIQQVINEINSGPAKNYTIIWMTLGYGPGSDRASYVDPFGAELVTMQASNPNLHISNSYSNYLASWLNSVGSVTYQTYWDGTDGEAIHNTDLGYSTVRAPFYSSTIDNTAPYVPTPTIVLTNAGAQTNVPRAARGSVNAKTGKTYVYWEDLYVTGDTFQTVLGKVKNGSILSLPPGNFTWKDFTQGNGNYGLWVGNGNATGCSGISGSGQSTHLYMVPMSSSKAGSVPQQSTKGTNPLFQIAFNHVTNPVLENLSLEYTDQPINKTSELSPTRPHMWNGVYFATCYSAAHVDGSGDKGGFAYNVWFNGFGNGDSSANPGETFPIDPYNTPDFTVRQCTIDGRVGSYAAAIPGNTTSASTKVTSTHIGYNSTSNARVINTLSQDCGYGHGISCYKTNGVTLTSSVFINPAHVCVNNEQGPAGGVYKLNGVTMYGGQRHMVIDSNIGSQKVTITNPIVSAGGKANAGPVVIWIPVTEFGLTNRQSKADITSTSPITYQ